MPSLRLTSLLTVVVLVASLSAAGKKKKKKVDEELPNQTLELPKEPPNAVVADSQRLVFHVSALTAKGLLSQQVREALKDLGRQYGGAQPVKLRAFVAGTGDLRRVPAIVSETFTEKRLPLPAVSTIQVGALPVEGAQVVLESISVGKKAVNPKGLAFISGQAASDDKPLQPIAPLAEKSLAELRTALHAASLDDGDVLRVTCFLTSLDRLDSIRSKFREAFPKASINYVQTQRAAMRSVSECEAVARVKTDVEGPARFVNPDGLPKSPNYSQIALVAAPRLAFSGTQLAFGSEDKDVRLAFQRLSKSLDEVKVSMPAVVMSSIYPLTNGIAEKVRNIRFEFYDKSRPPASTMLLFEGLQSQDASFGVDVIAAVP